MNDQKGVRTLPVEPVGQSERVHGLSETITII